MGAAVQTYWFAARTRYGQELKVRDRLAREGVEHFIPTLPAEPGRKEKAAVNNLVFLRTTKQDALELANTGVVKMRYIIDCATRTLLVVPDKQMEDFRRVFELGGAEETAPLDLGDRVRVIRGPLKGVEGRVIRFEGKIYVMVSLLDSLFAKAKVPRNWLERLEPACQQGLDGKASR